ncbi:suppressor of fused domain protein [Tomitella fengzijianii]|uniref:suppressor of fused domain protein n=1 Tax=Tomitella fengzijianii TaxID=2597660 RepID=UPI003558B7C6
MEQVEAHLVKQFGGPPAGAASVTFLGLEPIVVQAFVAAPPGPREPAAAGGGDTLLHLVSVGCSRAPMADPTEMVADPQRGPRAEIVVALRPTGGGVPAGLHRSVAVLAAAPAVEGVVLAADGIIDLAEPMWQGSAFTAVLLGGSAVPDLDLAPPRDPVRFLEAVPLTATEAAWVRVRGADELRAAWAEAQVDPRDPARRAVAL